MWSARFLRLWGSLDIESNFIKRLKVMFQVPKELEFDGRESHIRLA